MREIYLLYLRSGEVVTVASVEQISEKVIGDKVRESG